MAQRIGFALAGRLQTAQYSDMYEYRMVGVWVGISAALTIGTGCRNAEFEHQVMRSSDARPELSNEIVVDKVPVLRPTQGLWPAVALGDGQYLAVWEDHRARRPILYGGRIALDGATLDEFGFPILDAIPGTAGLHVYRADLGMTLVNFPP